MERRWRDAQTLGLLRHGWIVDRLHIDAEIVEQQIRDPFALGRIADHDRHDMARVWHMRNTVLVEQIAQTANAFLMAQTFYLADFQVLDRRHSTGGQGWRQRGCEDEAGRKRANEIAKRC